MNLDPASRLKLIQSLGAMPPAQFEEMVFALDLPAGVMSSFQAPQGQRAKELLDWAKGPTGKGLDSVLQVLSHYVSLDNLGITLPGAAPVQPPMAPPSLPGSPPPFATAKEVFISYAWGGDSEAMANKIDEAFQASEIILIRDKNDLDFKDSIKEFMEQIGKGKAVIVIISDKYLKSENCMFELVEIAANGDYRDRIFPIVLADAEIYKPVKRIRYIQHWEQEIADLDEAMKTVSAANMQGFRESIDLYTRIRNTIAELVEILKNMNTLPPDIHTESEFAELLKAIEQRLST
ncbi:MAG: toll/interleukin-1 receptor domain-containing protein [Leptolyngbya sp. SIOISBB]|nr:toll/interleukin-1 receptor domain-containing protein [Leptolyngbya sp. SIOISBB]